WPSKPMARRRHPILHRIAWLRRNRCSLLLASLCLFILSYPLLADASGGALWLNVALPTVLFVGVWALRVRWIAFVGVGLLRLLPMAAVLGGQMGLESVWHRPVALGLSALFIGAVTVALLIYVLDSRTINTDKVFGAVSAYVLIALTFALIFGLLQHFQP